MGVTWQEFWGMNPHIIKCLLKGQREKIEQELQRQDYMQFLWWGKYGISAVGFAVEHCLAGKKAKSKYVDKPVFSEIANKAEENKPMTEEDKIKQTEALFMKLRIMGANFNLNHKDGTVS